MLDVTQLHFDYADKPLLQDVNFTLDAGSLLHLQGANGAGKTTLLKLLAGLLNPTAGSIRYQGECIEKTMQEYRQAICYIGHKAGVSALLTPREHWHYDLVPGPGVLSFEQAVVELSLHGLEDTPCALLSAGQRRRVGLLRLLVSSASVWLLDEPWVALDTQSMLRLKQMIQQHCASGGQLIMTSHQPLPFEQTYQVYAL